MPSRYEIAEINSLKQLNYSKLAGQKKLATSEHNNTNLPNQQKEISKLLSPVAAIYKTLFFCLYLGIYGL